MTPSHRRRERAAARGPSSWTSRIAALVLSPVLFLLLLEWTVSVIWGPVYYPLPGVDEAAHYLHFTLPERFNPLFELRQYDDGPYMHTLSLIHI